MAGRALSRLFREALRISYLVLTAILVTALVGCGGGGGTVQPITVSVNPATASLAPGGTQNFTAAVANTGNTAVTWKIQEGATGGTITAAGIYTAPALAGTYHVLAVSVASPFKTGQATITVHAGITISPAAATVTLRQAAAFTATVTGASNTAVNWSVQEGAAGGAVDNAGHYTAPTAPGTYHLVATSQADPTHTAIATLTVVAGSATGTIN